MHFFKLIRLALNLNKNADISIISWQISIKFASKMQKSKHTGGINMEQHNACESEGCLSLQGH